MEEEGCGYLDKSTSYKISFLFLSCKGELPTDLGVGWV